MRKAVASIAAGLLACAGVLIGTPAQAVAGPVVSIRPLEHR